jgi:Protein of unknown function (DUF3572)
LIFVSPAPKAGLDRDGARGFAGGKLPRGQRLAEIAMTDRRRVSGGKADRKQRQERAEALAIAALGFIAAEPERLGRFLALTGLGPQSIRDAARESHFLAGVLDHIVGDERLLIDFAAEHDVDPNEVTRAREALAGRHWERELP